MYRVKNRDGVRFQQQQEAGVKYRAKYGDGVRKPLTPTSCCS